MEYDMEFAITGICCKGTHNQQRQKYGTSRLFVIHVTVTLF